jgi:hypothetical protein
MIGFGASRPWVISRILGAPGRTVTGAAAIGRGMGMSGLTMARHVAKNPAVTLAVGGGALGTAFGVGKGLTRTANKAMAGLMPNTAYPAASGRFGVRTASQAGPAGIQGLRFNFKRK